MIEDLFQQEAVITYRTPNTTRDSHGNLGFDETTETVMGFAQQFSESDARADEDLTSSLWWVFLPAGTAMNHVSQVTIAGLTLEVAGRVRRPTRPGFGEHHVEAPCRLVEG